MNSAWYVDVLRTAHDWLIVPFMNLAKQTWRSGGEEYSAPFALDDGAAPIRSGLPIESSPIAQLAPFIETMGPVGPPGQPPRRRKSWWGREWRHRGDLSFRQGLVAAFAPADEHESVRAALDERGIRVPPLLDPRWGLERMISALASVDARFAGPLPHY